MHSISFDIKMYLRDQFILLFLACSFSAVGQSMSIQVTPAPSRPSLSLSLLHSHQPLLLHQAWRGLLIPGEMNSLLISSAKQVPFVSYLNEEDWSSCRRRLNLEVLLDIMTSLMIITSIKVHFSVKHWAMILFHVKMTLSNTLIPVRPYFLYS